MSTHNLMSTHNIGFYEDLCCGCSVELPQPEAILMSTHNIGFKICQKISFNYQIRRLLILLVSSQFDLSKTIYGFG